MLRTLSLAASLAVAGTAQAGFVGGGVISLDSWNADASQPTGPAPAGTGQAVTVYRVYLAFDGTDSNVDQVNSIFGANIDAGGTLYQDGFGDAGGVHPNGAFIAVAGSLAWDSFVSINTLSSNDGGAVTPDGDGINFTATGMNGGYFLAGSSQGLAGTNPGGDFGTGLNLVLIGQFTVLGGGARADVIDIRSDGSLGDGGVFTGGLNIGINDQDNPQIFGVEFIPTPGAVVLFGLAGLTAARRRRG